MGLLGADWVQVSCQGFVRVGASLNASDPDKDRKSWQKQDCDVSAVLSSFMWLFVCERVNCNRPDMLHAQVGRGC
jgi:hypothetical protein